MLTVQNLTKKFRTGKDREFYANNDISLSIQDGQFVWIYGNSGSGKSTFLNCITGIEHTDGGKVIWDGIDISSKTQSEKADFRLNNMGIVFQFFELIQSLSVFENATLPLQFISRSMVEIKEIIFPLLEEFSLLEIMSKKVSLLSGGEKQRLAIIRALSLSPKIIIADEITASLDIELSHKVYTLLKQHVKKTNGLGIFVSHDPSIKKYADSVFKMESGMLFRADD